MALQSSKAPHSSGENEAGPSHLRRKKRLLTYRVRANFVVLIFLFTWFDDVYPVHPPHLLKNIKDSKSPQCLANLWAPLRKLMPGRQDSSVLETAARSFKILQDPAESSRESWFNINRIQKHHIISYLLNLQLIVTSNPLQINPTHQMISIIIPPRSHGHPMSDIRLLWRTASSASWVPPPAPPAPAVPAPAPPPPRCGGPEVDLSGIRIPWDFFRHLQLEKNVCLVGGYMDLKPWWSMKWVFSMDLNGAEYPWTKKQTLLRCFEVIWAHLKLKSMFGEFQGWPCSEGSGMCWIIKINVVDMVPANSRLLFTKNQMADSSAAQAWKM